MKKVILSTALFLGMFGAAQAQVGTGLFAGGSIGFGGGSSTYESGSTTVDGPKNSWYDFTPRVGYYFTDNIAAGVMFGIGNYTSKSTSGTIETKSVDNSMMVGVFGRYAMPLGDEGNFNLTGDLNISMASYKGETSVGSVSVDDDPQTSMGVGIAPGILFFPTSKIGLEAGLGNVVSFNSTTITDADVSTDKSKFTNFSILDLNTLGFNFGLNYYFGR